MSKEIPNCFYRISIKAFIINDQGEFLLTKEENGYRDLPGGGLDHGEDITSGLQREIKEEMQLKVDHIEGKCFDIVIGENLLNKYPAAYAIYKARLQSLDFTSSNECQEIQFYTPQEALKQKLFPIVKTFVKKLAT